MNMLTYIIYKMV